MLQMLSDNNFIFGFVGGNSALFYIPSGFFIWSKGTEEEKG